MPIPTKGIHNNRQFSTESNHFDTRSELPVGTVSIPSKHARIILIIATMSSAMQDTVPAIFALRSLQG